MPIDFRHIKPTLDQDHFLNVPCQILNIGETKKSYSNYRNEEIFFRDITVLRLNFASGLAMIDKAIMYEKTLDIFNDLNMQLPIETFLKIKFSKGKIEKIVYGFFNIYPFEFLVNGNQIEEVIFQNDETYLSKLFKKNYAEINFWLTANNINFS